MENVIAIALLLLFAFMRLVQWKLNEKAGIRGWIALVPFVSLVHDYAIAERRRWAVVHIILRVLAMVVLLLIFILIGTEYAVLSGKAAGGRSYALRLDHAAAVLVNVLAFLIAALILVRFVYARGLCRRFRIESRWDYPCGVVLLPMLFKARLALLSTVKIYPPEANRKKNMPKSAKEWVKFILQNGPGFF
jgi:hypothetical protein